jgi:GPN-loop GTPase
MSPVYGQVIVGPPGAGKTTFCNGMQQYLRLLGRDAWVVNFDPANEGISAVVPRNRQGSRNNDQRGNDDERLPYEMLFDVCEEAVELSSVMTELGLGPNGGLMYCMEYVEEHSDEIIAKIKSRLSDRTYLLLDFPGQVELVGDIRVYRDGREIASLQSSLLPTVHALNLCAESPVENGENT